MSCSDMSSYDYEYQIIPTYINKTNTTTKTQINEATKCVRKKYITKHNKYIKIYISKKIYIYN